jgi:hypothetical protein
MIRRQAGLASGAELKPFIAEIFVAAAVERERGPGRLTPTEAPPPAREDEAEAKLAETSFTSGEMIPSKISNRSSTLSSVAML